jgi:hypothetical protein
LSLGEEDALKVGVNGSGFRLRAGGHSRRRRETSGDPGSNPFSAGKRG